MKIKDRIEAIQRHFNLQADGLIGPDTLTAIERALGIQVDSTDDQPRLVCSRTGLSAIVKFEISSAAYYRRSLQRPMWPGGESGVTIGIGYDLGFATVNQLHRDWDGMIPDTDVKALERVCKLTGQVAKAKVKLISIQNVVIPLEAAKQVFYRSSLPAYAAKCLRAYPGVDELPSDAQAALLSLVFNRGASKSGSTRREMRDITPLVDDGDLAGIADQILLMKRLWEGRGLAGLLRRREIEADLVRKSERSYVQNEFITI